MTKADIYKAVSDLIYDNSEWIEDNKDVSVHYILGLNDMARHLICNCPDKPEPAPTPEPQQEKKSTRKIDLDMGRVKALRSAGWTIEKIADDLHVSSATISTRLKQEEGENAKLD